MVSTARHRALSGKRWKDLPPGQFAALISDVEDRKQSELQRQKTNLEVLLQAENLLCDKAIGPSIRNVFGFIGFVHNPAVREVIFKLHQHNWQVVPPETAEQCKTAFQGLGHSLGNERGFKEIKESKRKN